jgi:lipopolysaccharide assembly protein B
VNLLLLLGGGMALLVVGVLLGRFYTPDRRPLQRAAEEGRRYSRGLVALLDGRTEAAVEEIARALRVSAGSVEAFFALGGLFRRRGEHERAVRVHQAILVRRDIDAKTRIGAHHELARDFLEAGYPRRASRALEFVVAKDKRRVEAWRELAALYEESGAFERAALALRRVDKLSGGDSVELQGHLFAEEARARIVEGAPDAARPGLRRALSLTPTSPHALFVLGLYQAERKNPEAAASAWERALGAEPDLGGVLVPMLEKLLAGSGRPERLDALLARLLAARPESPHLRLAAARVEAGRDPGRALALLDALLADEPSLLPARRAAGRILLARGDAEAARKALAGLLDALDGAGEGFWCEGCGRGARELFWRCPSCRGWGKARAAWGRRAGRGQCAII